MKKDPPPSAHCAGRDSACFEAEDPARGLVEAATRKPDLAILDLVCRTVTASPLCRNSVSGVPCRCWCFPPVIVSMTKLPPGCRADDHMTKTLWCRGVTGGLRALMRRYPGSEKNDPVYEFGDICVDIAARSGKAGEEVHLTPIEFPPADHSYRPQRQSTDSAAAAQ